MKVCEEKLRREVVGRLWRRTSEWAASVAVKKMLLKDEINVPTAACASETRIWSERQRSKIKAIEMSYLRSAFGVR